MVRIMKIKNLLAISIFLLVILTIGAVSAEDISNATVGNVIEEDISVESPQDIDDGLGEIDESIQQDDLKSAENETLQANESQGDVLSDGDLSIWYDEEIKKGTREFEWGDYVYIHVGFPEQVTGKVKIQINGKTLTKEWERRDNTFMGLKDWMVYGDNPISVSFEGDHSYNTYTDVLHYLSKPEFMRDVDYEANQRVTLAMPEDADGTLYAYYRASGSQQYSTASARVQDSYVRMTLPALSVGVYDLRFEYKGDSKHYTIRQVENLTFKVDPRLYLRYVYSDGELTLNVTAPDSYSCNASFAYLGKDYGFEIVNGFGKTKIPMTIGKHYFTLTLNPGAVNEYSFDTNFEILPVVNVPGDIISSKDLITVDAGKGFNGSMALYLNNKYVRNYTFVNGKATISLYSSYDLGVYWVRLKVDGENLVFNQQYRTKIKKYQLRAVGSQIVLYQSGQTYQVKLLDLEKHLYCNQIVKFYVGGKLFKPVKTDAKGIAALTLTQLPGKYKVVAKFGNAKLSQEVTLSKTVVVKQILNLKLAAVKNSAKSLTLQASLAKVNGKYLKNKMITFMFNGKKYSAKTDSKGIAKVTIQNTVLKKLKVGKKITYTATYVKTTVKKTVTVKK